MALAAPRNGIVEIAGPERAPFNEIVARYLKAVGDPREVVSDPEARYYGGRVEERSLVPLGEARLGRIGFDEWLRRSKGGKEGDKMSLDNTSHPGRTGTDELVPSRYALRVGEIDVLVISDGVFPLPAATLATNADPADLAAWLDDMLLPPDVYKWPLNVVVVRSGGRTVLIDAGVGAEFPDFPRGGAVGPATGSRRHRSRIRDRRGAHPHARGPRWRAARRRAEGPAASGRADPPGGRRGRVLGVAPISPATPSAGGAGRASVGRQSGSWTSTAASCGRSRRSTRWRRGCSSVAPAATPPGTAWSAWRPAATG